jgi:hypothetical protein
MTRFLPLALCLTLRSTSIAAAEDVPERPTAEAQWLRSLRGSGSYRDGLRSVRTLVEQAYDLGAIAGASHWEDVHEYYTSVARAKGCERGNTFTDELMQACHRETGPEPKLVGRDYNEGLVKAATLADEVSHRSLVKRMLAVLYDYGYVQGLKHGLRTHSEGIRLVQIYFRSCMERANDAKAEGSCAEGAKSWVGKLLERLRRHIDAHGLSARSEPK